MCCFQHCKSKGIGMKQIKATTVFAVMAAGLSLSFTMVSQSHAAYSNTKDVVHDTNGHIVKNTFNYCVRTKWEAGTDLCAPKQEAPTPPVVKHVPRQYSRSYLVFFDWDKSTITPEAADVIRKAHADASHKGQVSFDLTGHADRSGSDSYNMKLSESRAMAVKDQLMGMGATSGQVLTTAKGEMDPLVPTADGVREPQNRRVKIMYYYVE